MVWVAVFPWGPHALGCWSHRWTHDCAEPPLAPPWVLDPWGRCPARFWPLLPPGLMRSEFCVFICSAPTAGPAPCQAVF